MTIDERDRKDYYTPSRSLFRDYCECVIDRYGLRQDLIRQERIEDIDFGIVKHISDVDEVFTVRSDKGVHYARSVVLAVGAGNAPSMPAGVAKNSEPCCHAMQIRNFPDPSVKAKMKEGKPVNIAVVGGGLTSAQVADLAVRHGAAKVWHLVRGRLKVKPFDIGKLFFRCDEKPTILICKDLEWMGKFKNHENAVFLSADGDEGGSNLA